MTPSKPSARALLIAYIAALLAYLALDAFWLGLTSAWLYQPAMAGLMAANVDWRAVALFYPLYVAGLLGLAIVPALACAEQTRAATFMALRRGALLGLVAYATYDLTNQATLRDWPWLLSLIDIAWGTLAGALATAAATRLALALTSGPAR